MAVEIQINKEGCIHWTHKNLTVGTTGYAENNNVVQNPHASQAKELCRNMMYTLKKSCISKETHVKVVE
jgi:hypothetical protein